MQYLTKQLNGPQLKWSMIEKEAFEIVLALKKLRPYLYSTEFEIIIDHKPLKSLFLFEIKKMCIQYWAVLLAEYGALITYR